MLVRPLLATASGHRQSCLLALALVVLDYAYEERGDMCGEQQEEEETAKEGKCSALGRSSSTKPRTSRTCPLPQYLKALYFSTSQILAQGKERATVGPACRFRYFDHFAR